MFIFVVWFVCNLFCVWHAVLCLFVIFYYYFFCFGFKLCVVYDKLVTILFLFCIIDSLMYYRFSNTQIIYNHMI